ncbi:hypothetical protein GOODEAATRI_010264, partial [Goodea atripinnis]
NLDCVKLLLQHGANPNVANYACQLPIHRAAYEGHILVFFTLLLPLFWSLFFYRRALRTLIPVTTKRAIRLSGQSPVHSAADGGQTECLELLIQKGYDVNAQLDKHISGRYELVKLLLSYGAEVNCYFRVISNTVFPTALQYCLRDQAMLRLLLNNGYQAHKHVY